MSRSKDFMIPSLTRSVMYATQGLPLDESRPMIPTWLLCCMKRCSDADKLIITPSGGPSCEMCMVLFLQFRPQLFFPLLALAVFVTWSPSDLPPLAPTSCVSRVRYRISVSRSGMLSQ